MMPMCTHCGEEVPEKSTACSICGSTLESEAAPSPEQYRSRLLIERVADLTHATHLTNALPGDVYPPYLLVGSLVFIDYGIIQTYNYLFTDNISWISNPANLTLALGLVVAVVGGRYMADEYADAIVSLNLSDRPDTPDPAQFETLIPLRIKLGVYGVGLALYYLNLFLGPGAETLIAVDGFVKFVIGQFVLAPLVNLVLVVEFSLLFLGIHLVLPRRIAKADPDLFFYDPRDMGGFGAVGQLLKRSYYIYTAGVLVYFVVAYGDAIASTILDAPYPEPGLQVAVFFTLAWGVGFVSIIYSMQQIHRLMSQKKQQRIRELEADLRGIIENPYDIRSSRVADADAMETKERQLSEVRATRAYPTTFTMWSQIAISVLLPQVLQLVVQSTL